MGVEPTRPAWKAGILPLNYTRGTLFIVSLRDVFVKHFFLQMIKNRLRKIVKPILPHILFRYESEQKNGRKEMSKRNLSKKKR